MISANGVEARFPFLDYRLISSMKSIDFSYFTDFNMPRGSGDKILLRTAADKIGLMLN